MSKPPKKILIIQTAFLGDVILISSLVEKLKHYYPQSAIHLLIRKGFEEVYKNHPLVEKIWLRDKKKHNGWGILLLGLRIRKEQFDMVINVHRFASSGLITLLSGANLKIGFNKNPFSFIYTHIVKHNIHKNIHETERNHQLIELFTDKLPAKPKLYPQPSDYANIKKYQSQKYYCIAPASVWFTKQWPKHKWAELINTLPTEHIIYLLGSNNDRKLCDEIIQIATHTNIINLAGKLSILESAALMQYALMNFVNDSAPLHIASAMNAPVRAIFCSTVTDFGFGPLSNNSKVIEIQEPLKCRPCGLHGHRSCPEKHFHCAEKIQPKQFEL
jgi:heptosyltransferase-2